jgi:hypothetical protein
MHNSKEQFQIIPVGVVLEDPAQDIFTWIVAYPIRVQRVTFLYTEATDGAITTPGAVSFDYTNTVGGVSRAEKGAYTAVISTPIGTEVDVYDGGSFVANATDILFFELKTQQSAGEAGGGYFILYYELLQD